MMLRALNHHLPMFKKMANVTMSNWSCLENQCVNPIEATCNAKYKPATFKRVPIVPDSWGSALEYLKTTDLIITATDQSDYAKHSITHIARRMEAKGLVNVPFPAIVDVLREIKQVTFGDIPNLRQQIQARNPIRWVIAQTEVLCKWAESIKPHLAMIDRSTLQTRLERRQIYQQLAKGGLRRNDDHEHPRLWATDGSHKREQVVPSTTAAVVGPSSGGFKLIGQYGSSTHGELLAHTVALIGTHRNLTQDHTILTDHLGTINAVNRSRSRAPDEVWQRRPAHELTNWLTWVAKCTVAQPKHVKAHTGQQDTESRLNDQADELAKAAHTSGQTTLIPALTGWMRQYVVYSPKEGYVPDNWSPLLRTTLERAQFSSLPSNMKARITGYDDLTNAQVPTFFYHLSPSLMTTKFQIILRTGTFTAKSTQTKKGTADSMQCEECGDPCDDTRHILIECPCYADFKTEAVERTLQLHKKKRNDKEWSEVQEAEWKQYVSDTVYGTTRYTARYYLGHTPPLPPSLGPNERRTAHHLAIILASRIAGMYLREKEKRKWEARAEAKRQAKERRTIDEGLKEIGEYLEHKHGATDGLDDEQCVIA